MLQDSILICLRGGDIERCLAVVCFQSAVVGFPRSYEQQRSMKVSGIQNTRQYLYQELCRATDNFSPDNKIGEGGFGSVYKGVLRDGTLAAIKVLSAESKQGVREFLTEITTIAEIEHENLIKLYGCCVEGNHRILVYGYLENNSLSKTLLSGKNREVEFSWDTRRGICIGIAQGLAFLHEEVRPHIVHRDIKASNVLLDGNFKPKISDFGLAKLFPSNMTHISTRVAGTTGYLAPEYALRGQLTRKADVYSFGILILEIVSGRRNMWKEATPEEPYLLELAWELHKQGELLRLIDKSMHENFDPEEACRYLKIGLLCTQEMPKLRPSMSTVVEMLKGELDLEGKKISRPGLITAFMGHRTILKDRDKSKDSSCTKSSGSGKAENSLFSSKDAITSFATMTFNSIYDRR
ncbi:cold-responsive protein kinase 1-like isoform X1 [Punica granatum]|uniref:Cold-responsive protein kinase 1-like isoform X1 n=2 Tax=Punica granatum TaxID=22663 RepID=A0A6P8C8R6_PUNGR|nr:cold-responsive protein kinase 1-like isoform X1 [Punica granatum]